MMQRDPRLIGGVYRTGQVITSSDVLTQYTAYDRNTNDVVGLFLVELPPTVEAQSAQRLLQPLERRWLVESPHVIQVHNWGVDGKRVYIATDPPRGITLRHVLDNENIDLQRMLDFAQQMTRGLIALHAQAIVGIDMRPQLITVDSVVVTDRVQLDDVGLRALLYELGYINSQHPDDIGYLDPRYVSPEYIQGDPIGPLSDIYQVGLLIFELVTGRLPFVGRNPAETGVLQSTAPAPRMTQFKHDTPPLLQDIVDRALAKNPAERFASATALLGALEELQVAPRPSMKGNVLAGSQDEPRQATNEIFALEGDTTMLATRIREPSASTPDTSSPTQVAVVEDEAFATEADVYALLCYEEDGVETQQFAITRPDVIVGRTDPKRGLKADIDLTALDPKMTVSRQHARIRYAETFFYIEDLKSRNKTRLGELTLAPLKPELLQHGDVVQFGALRLVFKVPGMKDVPASKAK
jgi:serine/threonine protein kinase